MTTAIEITGLNFQELTELRGRIDARVQEMRETGAPALRERFAQEAASLGLTIEEIVQTGKGKRGRPSNAAKHQEASA